MKTHQEKNCISRLIFRSKLDEQPKAESAPKKRRIVDTMQITQYKPILPRGGIQIGKSLGQVHEWAKNEKMVQ